MDWKDSEYLDETAFEQYLLDQGITPEQLEADLNDHLTLEGQSYSREHQIFEKDGESVEVFGVDGDAAPGKLFITDWLDNLPMETLMWFWEKDTERNKIKGLMRYPGGYHEWLMLAAIPMLKAMGVSMAEILNYRTPTEECCFYIGDTQCWHGREGSTTMHNDLFMEIGNAYLECGQRKVHHTIPVLKKYLRRFAEKYYGSGRYEMPDALKQLTGM